MSTTTKTQEPRLRDKDLELVCKQWRVTEEQMSSLQRMQTAVRNKHKIPVSISWCVRTALNLGIERWLRENGQ